MIFLKELLDAGSSLLKSIDDDFSIIPKLPPVAEVPEINVCLEEIIAETFVESLAETAKVTPVYGSVVYCDLACAFEHSGIYAGNGNIVHLNGNGKIEEVTAKQFLARLWGLNPASEIYVSSKNGTAVGSPSAADFALSLVGTREEYNLVTNNCHQFVSRCVSSDFDNSDSLLWMLKDTCRKEFGATEWRLWDR